MKAPPAKKLKPPLYWVTMCDMFNLLLAFYICMVSMSDTRAFGLVSTGKGIAINTTNAAGKPSTGTGEMTKKPGRFLPDSWWIDDQPGDPDQLEVVQEKLDEQIELHFKPDEAKISYQKNSLVIKLPTRISFTQSGTHLLDPGTMAVLRSVTLAMHQNDRRMIRISGDVPRTASFEQDLTQSAKQGMLISYWLQRLGVNPSKISLWGWGSNRPIVPSSPSSPANASPIVELWDAPPPVVQQKVE